MTAPTTFAPTITAGDFSNVALGCPQPQMGKTPAGHAIVVMNSSTNEITAKTDKVAAESREELVKNEATCNIDCCGFHEHLEGYPALVACTLFCFWNPFAWCCLIPAWGKKCCE